MPTYEYKCNQCGFSFEEFQSIVSEPLKVCPVCKKPAIERVINGGAGLIFKGSGFYLTDYKHKSSSSSETTSSSVSKTKEKEKEKVVKESA